MVAPVRRRRFDVKRPPPPKTTIAAALMLVGGIVLIILGCIVTLMEDPKRGLPLVVLGVLVFLPGSYASTLLIGAYLRWPGYSYNQVPSYDD